MNINKTWLIITVIICIVFTILFFPVARENVDTTLAIIYTIIGIIVIWAVYFIRGYFS